MKYENTRSRRIGRPLSFDREAALHQAMLLFWRHGYEATSLSQLTAAMGISPPSLYAAFGDKKQLFLEAVGRYNAWRMGAAEVIEEAPTAREAVWTMLRATAAAFTDPDLPAGCLLVSGATNCSPGSADVQAALSEIRLNLEGRLRARIQRDVDAGLLPRGTDAGVLAALYMTLIQGMSNQARDGATRDALVALAHAAMNAWPATPDGAHPKPEVMADTRSTTPGAAT